MLFRSLDNAIESQRQVMVDMGAKVVERQALWIEKHQRTSSLSQALENVKKDQLTQRNKREQKEVDDRSGLTAKEGWR